MGVEKMDNIEYEDLEDTYLDLKNKGEESSLIIILRFCRYCGFDLGYSKPSPTEEELMEGGRHLFKCMQKGSDLAINAHYN